MNLDALKRAAEQATHAVVWQKGGGSTSTIGGDDLRALIKAVEALRLIYADCREGADPYDKHNTSGSAEAARRALQELGL